MTKILIDEAVAGQALEYLQDNQHLIADNERHAYVMEYNAFIERFEQTIAAAENPAQQCWKCGDMDSAFQAKCDVPACGMKEQP